MKIDLHNHTVLCNHAEGTMEEYVRKAIKEKIDIFGFSEHAPMKNFEDGYRLKLAEKDFYEKSVLELQDRYRDQITILLGYEVDFIDGDFLLDEILTSDVDYLIGSVHYLDDWGFDNPEYIGEYEKRDIDTIWEEYYGALAKMAKTKKFDIVGHLDLMKVFNFLPTKDTKELLHETLKEIKKADMVIELNGSGFRKAPKEQYPSQEILQLAFELNIPITFGSDGHKVEQIGMFHEQLAMIAKKIGYKKIISFKKREKISHNF